MDDKDLRSLFHNEAEAQNVLAASRKRIDEIDNDLVDLIRERTSLAKDIVTAKCYLNMDIYDKSREDEIHNKTVKLAEKYDFDSDILSDIMNMLTILSKNKQKEILEE